MNPEGNILWQMSGPDLAAFHQGTVNALVVMDNNDVVVAGTLAGHFAVLRLDAATGAVLPGWPLLLGSGMATAAVADSHSNLIAGGFLSGTFFSTDMLVIKISPDGQLIWQMTAVGTSAMVRSDQVNALAVTRTDDIVAAGVLTNTGTSADAALVLLDGQTGGERWRQSVNGNLNIADAATSVAAPHDGTIIMGAQLRERNANAMFTLVAFHANGTERWRRLIPGTLPDFNDSAVAVALTHRGRLLVAAGSISNRRPFATLRLCTYGQTTVAILIPQHPSRGIKNRMIKSKVLADGRLVTVSAEENEEISSGPFAGMGAPGSSVASGAGLEPGAPRIIPKHSCGDALATVLKKLVLRRVLSWSHRKSLM